MDIQIRSLVSSAAAAEGTVVIIDVLRACTTVPILFSRGALEIWPISSESEITRTDHRYIAVGEAEHGSPSKVFDFNNSPSEVCKADLSNQTVFLKTNNATEAILAAQNAEEIILCSFVNISAVSDYILQQKSKQITILPLGRLGQTGLEDELCAEVLSALLRKQEFNQNSIINQVINCDCAVLVREKLGKPQDVQMAVAFDSFPVLPKVIRDGGKLVIRNAA